MEKELIKYEDQIYAQVTDNITLLTKALAESQNMIADLKAITVEKSRVISKLECENENNNKAVEQLNKELQSKNQVLGESEADRMLMSEMKINALRLADLINDEQEKHRQLIEGKTAFENEKKALVSENEKLKSNLENAREKYTECDRALNKAVVDNRKAINEKEEKIKKLMSKIGELESENNDLSIINKELEKEKNQMSDTICGQQEKLDKLKELNDTLEVLKKDKKWLIDYAKSTDEKVKKYYTGDKKALDDHRNWLCNMSKDDDFKKFFGDDSCENYNQDYSNAKVDEANAADNKNESDNSQNQKEKSNTKIERGHEE